MHVSDLKRSLYTPIRVTDAPKRRLWSARTMSPQRTKPELCESRTLSAACTTAAREP